MEGIKDSIDKINESLKALAEAFNKVSKGIDAIVKAQAAAETVTKPADRKTKAGKKKSAVSKKKVAARKVNPAAKKKPVPARKVKAAKTTPTKVTATMAVLNAIKNSDNGANVAFLRKQTGFDAKKIANNLYRLKKQGAIKTTGRGIYTSV